MTKLCQVLHPEFQRGSQYVGFRCLGKNSAEKLENDINKSMYGWNAWKEVDTIKRSEIWFVYAYAAHPIKYKNLIQRLSIDNIIDKAGTEDYALTDEDFEEWRNE